MQSSDSVGLDTNKIQQSILDVALVTMTDASDWQYRLESNELVLRHERTGHTFTFQQPPFSSDSDQAPLTNRTADVRIQNEGSLCLFHPLSSTAEGWFSENVDAAAPRFGNALVVEHRYARDLCQAIQDAGLEVTA